jgi:hypothetical protein
LSETGHQRRSRQAGNQDPHPHLRRITARKAVRILDPLKRNPKSSPVSISGDEYKSVSHMMDSDTVAELNSILKPHLE